jgi:hypothetical protein
VQKPWRIELLGDSKVTASSSIHAQEDGLASWTFARLKQILEKESKGAFREACSARR